MIEINKKILAYTPWPGAFTYWKGKRIKDVESHKKSLKVLVLNLFNAYRTDVEMPVGIPRTTNYYTKSPLGATATKNVLDMLIELGYVKQVRK